MPFYTDAYLADTHHLSTEAHGAYLLLLLHIWRCNGVAPPDDDRLLARITRQPLRRWKCTTRPLLEGFFTLDSGRWVQKRLDREWHSVQSKIEQNRQKAIKGNWIKNASNPLKNSLSSHAIAITQSSPSINHEPSTNEPLLKEKGDANMNRHSSQVIDRSREPESFRSSAHTPALNALKPILNDVTYFVRGGKTISPLLKPQLIEAAREVAALLQPITPTQADELVEKLFLHFPKSLEKSDSSALKTDLISRFAEWPYDLMCKTADDIIHSHPYPTLPPMLAFTSRVEPALHTRRKQAERIERLLAQL